MSGDGTIVGDDLVVGGRGRVGARGGHERPVPAGNSGKAAIRFLVLGVRKLVGSVGKSKSGRR